jgi:acyl-CoA thioester hydrolase
MTGEGDPIYAASSRPDIRRQGTALFERTFRVRFYECDPYGHVNHANYLRYIQETAFDASAAVGYDFERYRQLGQQWLIRETDITYLRPIAYGDSVVVRTWVGDFRRVRSRRYYELRLASTDEPVATASTDWVYLDSETLRPVSVPRDMIEAFSHPAIVSGGRRDPFPQMPPPPDGVFEIRRRVEWHDIDPAGHVNNANYLVYVEECNTKVAEFYGWPLDRILLKNMAIVARRYRIEYLEPAVIDDELSITTYIANVRRSTAERFHEIRRVEDGRLLARATALWVFVDLTTGRPIRIPAEFMDSFRPNVTVL